MPNWSQQDIHPHMHVYASDGHRLGHVAEVYTDSFLVHKGIFPTDRYFPYSSITTVQNDQVQLVIDVDVAKLLEWEKRPNYEAYLGDPTPSANDQGHEVHDPFDATNPNS